MKLPIDLARRLLMVAENDIRAFPRFVPPFYYSITIIFLVAAKSFARTE